MWFLLISNMIWFEHPCFTQWNASSAYCCPRGTRLSGLLWTISTRMLNSFGTSRSIRSDRTNQTYQLHVWWPGRCLSTCSKPVHLPRSSCDNADRTLTGQLTPHTQQEGAAAAAGLECRFSTSCFPQEGFSVPAVTWAVLLRINSALN